MNTENKPINIIEHLKKGHLNTAIQELDIFFQENEEEYHDVYNTYVAISSNYKELENKEIKNLISESDYLRERSKITDALIKVQNKIKTIRIEKKVEEIKAGNLDKHNKEEREVNSFSNKVILFFSLFVGVLIILQSLGILPSKEKATSNQEIRHIANKLNEKLALIDSIYTHLRLDSPAYSEVLFANKAIEKSKSDISTKFYIDDNGDSSDFVDRILIFSCYLIDAIIVSNSKQHTVATKNAIRSGIFNFHGSTLGQVFLSKKAMFFKANENTANYFHQVPVSYGLDSNLFEIEKKCLVSIGIENILSSSEGTDNANKIYAFPQSVSVSVSYILKGCNKGENCKAVKIKYILVYDISRVPNDSYDIAIRTIYESHPIGLSPNDFDCTP